MSASWQQVFALDAKFNAYRTPNKPSFRTLYIRRRSQLLRENAKKDVDHTVRKQHLKIRSLLLKQRYSSSIGDQTSRSLSFHSGSRITLEGCDSPMESRRQSLTFFPSSSTFADCFAFSGVHHIFDQHSAPVTMIRFANNNKSLLACVSMDGCVSVCDVTAAQVLHVLKGHSAGVTGLEWSVGNELLVSCSLDGTLRLWDVEKGTCVRCIPDPQSKPVFATVFHPVNYNWLLSGNGGGMVSVVNMSTGIFPQGGSSQIGSAVTAMAFHPEGNLFWVGEEKGVVVSFLFCLLKGSPSLQKARRVVLCEGSPITSLQARSWLHKQASEPHLLASIACNALCLFRVIDAEGSIKLKRKFAIKHRTHAIKSIFSPLMSMFHGAVVVSGDESGAVCLLEVEKGTEVNTLSAHAAPVLSVHFNYDESLLASSDAEGLVIVWRKAST